MAEKLLFTKWNFHKKQDKKPGKGQEPEKSIAADGNILPEDTEELPAKQRMFGAGEGLLERISAEYGFVVEQDITYVHTRSFIE